jgi:hypothetical protein
MNEFLLVIKLYLEIKRINILISELALSDSLYELKVSLRQLHMPVVGIIPDLFPPVLIILSLNKLLQLILLCHFTNFLSFDIIALVIV